MRIYYMPGILLGHGDTKIKDTVPESDDDYASVR